MLLNGATTNSVGTVLASSAGTDFRLFTDRALTVAGTITGGAAGTVALRGDSDVTVSWPLVARLAPMGLLTGFAAGFFGIGGGFLIVPGLMAATGMTLANAAASSLLSVSLFGAATSANYAVSGLVDWPVAGLFIAGGMVGGAAGLFGARFLAERAALGRKAFAVLVLLVAAYVAMRALNP